MLSSSKRSESSLDEEDQVSIIKRLTRQVRSLKQKIKQYEEEFESQYHAKVSTISISNIKDFS